MGRATWRGPARPGIGPGGRAALTGLLAAGLGCAGAALGSCARQGAPPGGPPDRRPPYVISTRPDTFAVVEAFRDPVVFRFSERISEQATSGSLDAAAVVSPATSQVRVEHGRDALEVTLLGGFRAGRVYRVTLRPVIRDMFGNVLQRPFELVFSTGGEFHPNTVAGLVEDRITGEAVAGARVDAAPAAGEAAGDTITYTSRTDEDGIFALRYLPPGEYVITAFEDRNRDGTADPFETRGSDTARLAGPADTLLRTIPILAADTTPARIAEAEAMDSSALRIATDDHLDPARSLEEVRVTLHREEGRSPAVDSLLHAHEWAERQAVLDSLAAARADTVAADTAGAAGPGPQPLAPGGEGRRTP
ncbi:MAG: hypothetical protein GWM92_21230, partial [Gemmatimonadetes bacterium]|nr:hypothetical protein [Gemmatimonadota bacterium]NIR81382.1 hypothetical protein [Gemmatimonadota bacterium]NIT90214.1 hypothetical protein [Gemmatimonadota bacterium]NIU34042.1 hypothetical protein [Gemmatimonadota bacterium]NIU38202.1 hypothetical protein [Gemmatimonadota bacterium]